MRLKKGKRFVFGMIFVLGVILFSLSSVSAYLRSTPQFTQYQSPDLFGLDVSSLEFDEKMCQAGQDFVIQIAPFGCEPAVVRDDLLEEQNVPVFCQLAATKINPLIDVEAIDSLSISGDLPPEVAGIGFQPAQAALGTDERINSPILDNIGYAVIVLKKQSNASAMPEYVVGNLSAKIKYDIKNAFGVGSSSYYLPVLTDDEWEEQKTKYSFWRAKGYLRAEEVGDEEAVISVYDDTGKVDSVRVKEGEKSRRINLPGFTCFANLELKLDGLKKADTRARLNIDQEYIEVAEGETFLEGKCRLESLEKAGLTDKVEISCKEDDSDKLLSFGTKIELFINPKIRLSIDGEEKNLTVGDKLYSTDKASYYLGYARTKLQTGLEKDLEIVVLALPITEQKEKLDKDDISYVAGLVKAYGVKKRKGEPTSLGDIAAELGQFTIGSLKHLYGYVVKNKEIEFITFDETKKLGGREIRLLGLSGFVNRALTPETLEEPYDSAIDDYKFIINNFFTEKASKTETYGESAYYDMIQLARDTNQVATAQELCQEFKNKFPESKLYLYTNCDRSILLANEEIASEIVFVNGKSRRIGLIGVYEPDFNEFGAIVLAKNSTGATTTFYLEKNLPVGDLEGQYLELLDAEENAIKVQMSLMNLSGKQKIKQFITNTRTLKLNVPETFGSDYTFTLMEVNLDKSAKVSVIPNIDNIGSQANFSFKIGIEKRSIQLSPGQTKRIIQSLNKTIRDWSEKEAKLGNLTQNMKKACLGVGAALIVKNFFANIGGKGIARENVMAGPGGWNEKCANAVSTKKLDGNVVTYSSVKECLVDKAGDIENDVENYARVLESQNDKMKKLQEGITTTSGPLGEKHVDTDELESKLLTKEYKDNLKVKLKDKFPGGTITVGTEEVPIDKFVGGLSAEGVTANELRDLEFNAELKGGILDDISKKQLERDIASIYTNTKEINALAEASKKAGVSGLPWTSGVHEKTRYESYKEYTATATDAAKLTNINSGMKIQGYRYKGKDFIVELQDIEGKGEYGVKDIYTTEGVRIDLSDPDIAKANDVAKEVKEKIIFKKYDTSSYKNNGFNNAKLQYFETGSYEGLPAIVPFDLTNGWYAAVKQTLPVGRSIAAYDKSGRVSSFYLCNVGENHLQEFYSGSRDDICQMINLGTGQPYNQFPGLSKTEAEKLVKKAVEAIEEASRKHKPGISGKIKILGELMDIGAAAADIPDMQCENFMSVRDCQILFNVCDPVVCPSSRCDLGGAYPVKDVVQTGIIGGLVLCLPNFQQGIYIPLCLTGIDAGIQGLISVYTSYRDCLQESLDTGKMVGICDEIYSIHLCEFFWRQAAPLAQVAIPKLVGALFGKTAARGGGEYLSVQNAWDSASKSLDIFTSYYGASSFAAFKARSMEEIGSLFCKSFISGVGPNTGSILDQLTEPDSPPQFHGRLEIVPFTTTTSPPTSQYKVFYHIYSGQGGRAIYKVYLKAPTTGTFYRDIGGSRIVAQGYIAEGDYASETVDFTAPTGYNELCINVNGQEECGFKTVSTSFAFNYVSDKYKKEQLTETVTTEADCISGTTSAYSLIGAGLGGAAEELVNPQIYNRGIIRICASENPGMGSDAFVGSEKERWKEVGYCGDKNMKCWLDTSTITDIIKNTAIENDTLSELQGNSISVLKEEGKWINDFDGEYTKLTLISDEEERVEKINELYEKVFYNKHKAKLVLLRAKTYGNIARDILRKKKAEVREREKEEPELEITTRIKNKGDLSIVMDVLKKGEVVSLEVGELNQKDLEALQLYDASFDGALIIEGDVLATPQPKGEVWVLRYGIGQGLKKGTIIVNGHTDANVGYRMEGGSVTINGDVYDNKYRDYSDTIGERMTGGKITITGDAKERAIGRYMQGGTIEIQGKSRDGGIIGWRMQGGSVTINGDVEKGIIGINMTGGELTIKGNVIEAASIAERMQDGLITVEGNAHNVGTIGFRMLKGKVNIKKNAYVRSIGTGLRDKEAEINIGGDASGDIGREMFHGAIGIKGNVVTPPSGIERTVGYEMDGGAIYVQGSSEVSVGTLMGAYELAASPKIRFPVITIMGDVGGDAGNGMVKGEILIKGNVKGSAGRNMAGEPKNSRIEIIGKVEGLKYVGATGGELTIKGDNLYFAPGFPQGTTFE